MTTSKQSSSELTLKLLTPVEGKLWGLTLEEWQTRAFAKIGVRPESSNQSSDQIDDPKDSIKQGVFYIGSEWVLSAELAKAFRNQPQTALVVTGKIIAVNALPNLDDQKITSAISKNDHSALQALNFTLKTPIEIAGEYNEVLRKRETPFALSVKEHDISVIEQKLFDSSYKGITDFVTKFIWPVPAFHVTRMCAALKISPNTVTTLSLILTIVAMYFFWQGQWAAGFVAGWGMTFLDTVDGKLARTTMSYSKWGNIYDHGIDLIHPPFWYWAWFVGLQGTQGSVSPVLSEWLILSLIAILAGYLVDRVVEGLFILKFKFHIHVWRPIDSFVRIITARRNPNTFIFMVAILFIPVFPQAGIWGFVLVAVWTWLCIFFHIWRLLQAYLTVKNVRSWLLE